MQQINLYAKEFQPDRSPLRLVHMLWVSAFFIALMIVYSMFYTAGITNAKSYVDDVERQITTLREELNVFSVASAATKTVSWERKIAEAQAQLDMRTQIRALIQEQNFGNSVGFSGQLTAIAHNSSENMSLTEIALRDGGTYVELKGVVNKTDAVPLYLQQLHADPAFTDSTFGVITITQDEKNKSQHTFSISKAADNKE